jgi:chorismate mutase
MAHSPWYILGPCSAETREQTLLTARQLKEVCGDVPFIYRAGAWKPRTSPHTFQGAGDEALGWLQAVKAETGVPVATEVASPEHVRKALEAGIDYLWIGARTSANPLATQAIADAIKGLRDMGDGLRGILIKNPVNADAALWLGNIERLEKTGVPVVAVHRGCNHQPCWSMAHTVRLARPDIPMLLDPSHMSGDAKQVPALLRKVDELGLDGAMIEVHCSPEAALSDKQQQITPTCLRESLDPIPCRNRVVAVFSTHREDKELLWLRAEIDELDDHLWDTLAARMDVSRRIGEWKKAHGVAPLQPERVKEIGERLKERGEKLGLSEAWMLRVWELIHEESLKQQK